MAEVRVFLLVVLTTCSCTTREENDANAGRADTMPLITDRAVARTADLVLSEAGLGPARMCAPLATAAATLGPARDSTFVGEAEDDRWPGKLVRLPDGDEVLLESSWVDSTRVWRISTTSPRAKTRGGARVGMLVPDIPRASGPLEVQIPEGRLVLELKADSVWAFVDSASEHEFHRRWTPDGDWLSIVPRSARIAVLSSAGRCQHPDSAA